MYNHYPYVPQGYYYVPYPYQAFPYDQPFYEDNSREIVYEETRQQSVKGQATWTQGGAVTKCGIPWSNNEYMTVAVGANAPYQCGQTLKVRNLSSPGPREILATVVDQVRGYPPNKINLHRRAFRALGANPSVGMINVEIIPSPELEEEKWGEYLLGVTQSAYSSYNVTDYSFVGRTQVSTNRTKETYDFMLKSPQEEIKVRGEVLYDPKTDRILSFNLKEMS